MDKYINDSKILFLQHKLSEARANRREAENTGCSDELILSLMDEEDNIVSQLLKLGCHIRDTY